MNLFKLYGIGNALLDYEYKVNDEMLNEMKLSKGTMLLNEYDDHSKLHQYLKNIRPPEKIIPGGSVANSVFAMSQFGDKVCFSGKVSNDETGDNFISCLNESNVTTYINKNGNQKSGECLVLISPDNERTMNTYLGSSNSLSFKDIDIESLEKSEYVLIEGYLVSSDETLNTSIKIIEIVQNFNTKVVITLSDPNIVNFFRDNIKKLFIRKADIVFCNEQEALNFAETDDLSNAKDFLRDLTDAFIITLGSKGAICFDGSNYFEVNGIDVASKDFTGAGDMFLGAFMHKYNGKNAYEAINFANLCASKIIQVYGAKLNNKKDYSDLIESFK
tara:strand:- start:6908 stop:7900 length:993 start_codon:yes stop_codon:yes gene_type:complete